MLIGLAMTSSANLSTWRQFRLDPADPQPISGGYLHPFGFVIGQGYARGFCGDFTQPLLPDFAKISQFNGCDIQFSFSHLQDSQPPGVFRELARFRGTTRVIGQLKAKHCQLTFCDIACSDHLLARSLTLHNHSAQTILNFVICTSISKQEGPLRLKSKRIAFKTVGGCIGLAGTVAHRQKDEVIEWNVGSIAAGETRTVTLFLAAADTDLALEAILSDLPADSWNEPVPTPNPSLCQSSIPILNDALDELAGVVRQLSGAVVANPPLSEINPPLPVEHLLEGRPLRRLRLSQLAALLQSAAHHQHPFAPCLMDHILTMPVFQSPWQDVCEINALWNSLIVYFGGMSATAGIARLNPHRLQTDSRFVADPPVINGQRYRLEKKFYRRQSWTEILQNQTPLFSLNQDAEVQLTADRIEIRPQVYGCENKTLRPPLCIEVAGQPALWLHDLWLEGELAVFGLTIRWRMQGKLRKVRIKNTTDKPLTVGLNKQPYPLGKNGIIRCAIHREYRQPEVFVTLHTPDGLHLEPADVKRNQAIQILGYAFDPYGFPLRFVRIRCGSGRPITVKTDAVGLFRHNFESTDKGMLLEISGRRGVHYKQDFPNL